MKKIQNFFALTATLAMLASSAYGQDYYNDDIEPYAYEDSGNASEMSALIPIGILVAVGLGIAFSHHGHHHNHRGSSSHSH